MRLIVILGPTGVGKTKLSIELAKKLNGEIINADSTQVYKGLDIATAKVKDGEKENIVHHLFDIKEITDNYTVYDYQRDCRKKIDEITKIGKTPILVGGTGLYIKAALYNYEFNPNQEIIEYDLNNEELYNELLKVDPDTKIHLNNRKRVIRDLNYYRTTGKKFSDKEKTDTILYDVCLIGLRMDRDKLYERINNRVDLMINEGLLEEAKKIYDSNIRSKAVLTPIGYKELFPYFDEIEDLNSCIDKIKQKSRNYAKKQFTWFNNQMDVNWCEVNIENFDETINNTIKIINKLNK